MSFKLENIFNSNGKFSSLFVIYLRLCKNKISENIGN
jgi:hypothetical protein